MIDFHTHVLPCMDDGSKSVDESLLILDCLKQQGVKKVIATPHFYANDESVENFFARRNASFSSLKEKISDSIQIISGAEVKFYSGISHLPDLKKLRIEGSKFLLLEMPFSKWTESDIKEIIDIAGQGQITLVLAHIERYISFQKKEVLQRLLDNDVLFQSNASFFKSGFSSFKAMRMLKNNQIHFIGSDCHNMTDRAPNIGKAFLSIERKCGEAFVNDYINYGNALFLENKTN